MTGVADNNYDLISNRTNLINNHNLYVQNYGVNKTPCVKTACY